MLLNTAPLGCLCLFIQLDVTHPSKLVLDGGLSRFSGYSEGCDNGLIDPLLKYSELGKRSSFLHVRRNDGVHARASMLAAGEE